MITNMLTSHPSIPGARLHITSHSHPCSMASHHTHNPYHVTPTSDSEAPPLPTSIVATGPRHESTIIFIEPLDTGNSIREILH